MDAAGTNKSITRQELQTYNAGTLTTDVKVLDLSATWNDAGVTFTGLKFNVTDTASNAASLLLDLQVGGNPIVSVRKDGQVTFVAGSKTAPSVKLSTSNGGLYGRANGFVSVTDGSTEIALIHSTYAQFRESIGLSGGDLSTNGSDVYLVREAANNLSQRRTTNAQIFRIYRTYTDASNYQRITNTWSTSTAVIHNEGAGTSVDGSIAFNDAALATDTTKGFIMIPSCAGAPTGTPADIPTGQIPIVFDSTNNKLYVYDGGWISTAALT
jgi:hypothetical protein